MLRPADEFGVRNAPQSSRAVSRVFTLRGVRNDGAGHPALVLRPRVHRLAAALFVVRERLCLALNECATDGNNLHTPKGTGATIFRRARSPDPGTRGGSSRSTVRRTPFAT